MTLELGPLQDDLAPKRKGNLMPTDEQVERAARALASLWGLNWECVCAVQRGMDCDCGDAIVDDVDYPDDGPGRNDCRRAVARAVLNALEAAR